MNRSVRRRCAFTLVELLIVVSVITLLMSILLPSLSRAREAARKTQCASRLRAIFVAMSVYVGEEGRIPPLNHEENEGAWQYNYLIYDDDEDFDFNFGPLARPNGIIQYVEELYCPMQEHPYHSLGTEENPWPVQEGHQTRAGYGRRFGLSGKSLSQIPELLAFAADVLHLPEVVLSGHKTGINVVYTDGHAEWVDDPGILTYNELSTPFDPLDNPIMKEIWTMLDEAGR
jgi:prepilin-type N-terminal cleavage/methylation domain-containing protein/prepilin-type processing-associated H-X9-DG protein